MDCGSCPSDTNNPALTSQHQTGHLTEGHPSNKGEQKWGDLGMSEGKISLVLIPKSSFNLAGLGFSHYPFRGTCERETLKKEF